MQKYRNVNQLKIGVAQTKDNLKKCINRSADCMHDDQEMTIMDEATLKTR